MANQAHPHLGFAITLAMTMALGPLAVDTYLPAFPAIASSLQVNVHQVSLSISVYIFTLAFGQLIAGPLSDRFGREFVMLSGLGLFSIASLLISQAQSLAALLIFRGLQAFAGGWAMVGVPAIVRDHLSGNEAARFFSLIGLIMIIAPAIAPSLGSLLLATFDWMGIFKFLAIYALLMALLLKWVIFKDQKNTVASAASISAWQRYKTVFTTPSALRFMFLQGFAFSVMLIFITHASFIYQSHFNASPAQFALLFGANIVLMIVFNLTNRQLLKYFPAARILRWGLILQALGIGLLITVMMFAPKLSLFLPSMMITVGALGAVTPNIQACYMDHFPEHGGTAAALLGAVQFSLAGSISAASAQLPETVFAIVLAQAGCSLMCLLIIFIPRQALKP